MRSSAFSVFGRSGPTPYRSTVGPGFYHLNFGRSFGLYEIAINTYIHFSVGKFGAKMGEFETKMGKFGAKMGKFGAFGQALG